MRGLLDVIYEVSESGDDIREVKLENITLSGIEGKPVYDTLEKGRIFNAQYGEDRVLKTGEGVIDACILSRDMGHLNLPKVLEYDLKGAVEGWGEGYWIDLFEKILENYTKIFDNCFEVAKEDLYKKDVYEIISKDIYKEIDFRKKIKNTLVGRNKEDRGVLMKILQKDNLSVKDVNGIKLDVNGYEAIVIGERVFIFKKIDY